MILNCFITEKEEHPEWKQQEQVQRVGQRLGVSKEVVGQVIQEAFKKHTLTENRNPNRSYKRIFDGMDEDCRNRFRKKVHSIIQEVGNDASKDKKWTTLEMIREAIKNDTDFPAMSKKSLRYVLNKLHFRYISRKEARNSMLVERPEVKTWRMKYIRAVRQLRALGRPVYYLDESYINCSHCPTKLWVDKSVESAEDAKSRGLSLGPKLPSGAGKRVILIAAGNESGFLSAEKIFLPDQANPLEPDYHGDVDGKMFRKWISEVLELIPEGSGLVLDNASYHCLKVIAELPLK